MYKIRKLADSYQFAAQGTVERTGTLAQICAHAVYKYQFDINEIEVAVTEMEFNDHDIADFGFKKLFIFSKVEDKKAA